VTADLGFGIGLRPKHYPALEAALDGRGGGDLLGRLDWFEVISENYFGAGGNPRRMLRKIRQRFPVVLHGVTLSLGSTDPLDLAYLDRLAALATEIEPAFVSDHLCWGGVGGQLAHDLLPLPFSEEALDLVAARIAQVQDHLRRPFVVENVSSYVAFAASTMTEWEFLAELCARTGCQLLLDVNNVFVSAHNHGFDSASFITGLPRGSVAQIHLAGHSTRGPLLLDTHDHAIRDEVWQLYQLAISAHGPTPTLIEWDDHIPPLADVVAEADRARARAAAPVPVPSPAPVAVPQVPSPSSPTLHELQARFFALVTAREDVAGALARLALGPADAEALAPGDSRLDAVGRIGIYNDMYFLRLVDVLRDDFPTVAAVLGEDDYRTLVADYLGAHPPRDRALRELGRALPAFLAGFLAGTGPWSRPWLADLAAFEWARADVFDAPDATPLTLADVQDLPPEDIATLGLRAIPAMRVVDVGHAVDETWRTVDRELSLVLPRPQPLHFLVWRAAQDVVHRRVSAEEQSVLPALVDGLTFGGLCDRLGEGRSVDDAAKLAFELLANWLAGGLLRQ
jgi:uncharacterized protein (UPF0276 family)